MNDIGTSSCCDAQAKGLSRVKDYLEMFKIHLCIYISLSGVTGHVMALGRFSAQALISGGLLLFLAMGSAILNNIQDREYDKSFFRTCFRCLPQEKVSLNHAWFMAATMILIGLSGLLYLASWSGFLSGLVAVLMYNGLYTPLKKRTLAAIVPGTISGMLPVLIGWTATGQSLSNPILINLMVILGLWQIPHFFIILLKNSRGKRLKSSGEEFPCFTAVFSRQDMHIQVLIWTSLYSLAVLLFLVAGTIDKLWVAAVISLNALAVLIPVSVLVILPHRFNLSFAFAAINLSMLLFLGAGICDKASF